MQDIHITRDAPAPSNRLFTGCANGQHFPKGQMTCASPTAIPASGPAGARAGKISDNESPRPTDRSGVRVAAGDVNGDGRADDAKVQETGAGAPSACANGQHIKTGVLSCARTGGPSNPSLHVRKAGGTPVEY